MVVHSLAQNVYSSANTQIAAPRSAEYEIFARVTRALRTANTSSEEIAALHDNRRLWTLLATEVADGSNELPDTLRAQLFYLAEFTNIHTTRILKGDATAEVLVDINTAVMRGLSSKGGDS